MRLRLKISTRGLTTDVEKFLRMYGWISSGPAALSILKPLSIFSKLSSLTVMLSNGVLTGNGSISEGLVRLSSVKTLVNC